MVLEQLSNKTVNLPFLGTVSVAVLGVSAIAIYLLTRRKKSVQLRF